MSRFLLSARRHPTWWAMSILMGLVAICGSTRDAFGQGSAPPSPGGYTNYWPGACAEAMARGKSFYWRAREDTALYTIASDTMLGDESRIAHDCVARFASSGATLTSYNLLPLASVLIATGDNAGAQRAIVRRLAEPDVRSPKSRAWVLAQIISMYLSASPAQVDVARGYLAKLDALRSPDAAPGQVRAWLALTHHYNHVDDGINMRAAADSTIKAGMRLNKHDRAEFAFSVLSAYRYIANAEGDRTGAAAAPLAVLARASTDIGELPGIADAIAGSNKVFSLYGTKGLRLVADAWVGLAGDTVHPSAGGGRSVLSLQLNSAGKLSVLNFQPSRSTIPVMSRLSSEVGDSIDIGSAFGTQGYFRDLGPLTMATELPQLRKYFVDELRVPGGMAITETHYNRLPDGRRVSDPNANDKAYQTRQGTSFVVFDREGIIRRIWLYWGNSYEPGISKTLKKYKQPAIPVAP